MPPVVMVVVMATAIMVAVAMMPVVMVQMVAAAEHKTGSKRHNEQFKEILVHDADDRRLSLFMNQAHKHRIFI